MRVFAIIGFSLISFGLYASIQQDIQNKHNYAYSLLDSKKDSAFIIGLESEIMAKEAGLIWEEANSIFIQAWVMEHTDRTGLAFQTYLRAAIVIEEELLESSRNQKLYLQLLGNISFLLSHHEAYAQASQFFKKSYDLALEYGQYSDASNIMRIQALMYYKQKDFHKASVCIEKALALKSQTELKILFGVWNLKGLILIKQDKICEAREYLNLIVSKAHNNYDFSYFRTQAIHNIGYSFYQEENYSRAIQFLHTADSLNATFSDLVSHFQVLNDLAKVHLESSNYDDALIICKRALQLYKNVNAIPSHYSLFTTLSRSYAALGNYEEAQKYADKYMTENIKYLGTQEMLLKAREDYQMEELAARFFMSIDDVQDKSLYWIILSIISSSFTVILLAGMTKNHLAKRALKKSLQEISRDSWS